MVHVQMACPNMLQSENGITMARTNKKTQHITVPFFNVGTTVYPEKKVTLYFKVSGLQCNYTFKDLVIAINNMYLL